MKRLIVLAALTSSIWSFAQDKEVKNLRSASDKTVTKDPNDTIPKVWKLGGILSLNVSQGTLSNWAAGGEDFSLALNSLASLFAFYKKGRHSWDNTFDFNLGYVKTTSLGARKNDDRFDLFSKYGYAIAPKVNLAGVFDFRSQIFKGYTYPENIRTYSSNFLAPAYLLLGVGLDWKPTKHLSVFVSPATARWIIVRDTALSNKGLYGVKPGDKSTLEFGAFASILYFKDFNKVLAYKGRLELFSNYRHNPQNVDLYMTNLFSAKVSKILSVTWGLDLIYDDDVRLFGANRDAAGLQLKSLVGIGFLVNLGKP